ncbi:hypothetical protein Tco_1561912 [Tanacetum coccineum]
MENADPPPTNNHPVLSGTRTRNYPAKEKAALDGIHPTISLTLLGEAFTTRALSLEMRNYERWDCIEEFVQYQEDSWDDPLSHEYVSLASELTKPTMEDWLKRAHQQLSYLTTPTRRKSLKTHISSAIFVVFTTLGRKTYPSDPALAITTRSGTTTLDPPYPVSHTSPLPHEQASNDEIRSKEPPVNHASTAGEDCRKYSKSLLLLVVKLLLLVLVTTARRVSAVVSSQVVAAAKLPVLNPGEFNLWKLRIEQYFLMIDYALWEVIVNGDSPQPKRTIDGVEQTYPHAIVEEKLARKNELNAKGLEVQNLISQLEILGETISQEDMYLKFLRNLLSEWKTHTLIWRNKLDLDTLSMDDLYNNLKIYETKVKGSSISNQNSQNVAFVSSNYSGSSNQAYGFNSANTDSMSDVVIYSFFVNQSNSLQLNDVDLQQIDADDLEEIDLKCECYTFIKGSFYKVVQLAQQRTGNRRKQRKDSGPTEPIPDSQLLIEENMRTFLSFGEMQRLLKQRELLFKNESKHLERERSQNFRGSRAKWLNVTTTSGSNNNEIDEFHSGSDANRETKSSYPKAVTKLLQQLQLQYPKARALRAKEKRNKPPTKAQKKSTMSTYLKHIGGYKHSQLKNKSFDETQKLFDKEMTRVNMFVDMDTEMKEGSNKAKTDTSQESSSKRAGDELEQKKAKK